VSSVASIHEIVETIKRTSLPTIISEGKDDAIVSRPIERHCADIGISFLPVGGKGRALDVWKNLPLHIRNRNALWIDQDLWVFFGVPNEFVLDRVILSTGYSVENDIFSDYDFKNLMSDAEIQNFHETLTIVASWFGNAVSRIEAGEVVELKRHPNDVLNELQGEFRHDPYDVESCYLIKLRGKTLMSLYLKVLSNKTRSSKYSGHNLLELGASVYGPCLQRIETEIRALFPVDGAIVI
jgi:hypothetical protein